MTSDGAIRATPTLPVGSAAPPGTADPGRRGRLRRRPGPPHPLGRWLLGLLVGLLTAGALVLTLNLHTPSPTGAADDGPVPLWSPDRLALLPVALVAAGAGLAAVAASATSYRRAAVVVLPLLGLVAVPWWSRFLVATSPEPVGLLGAVWLLLGTGVLAVTAPAQRWSRLAGLASVVAGGVVAGTAAPGFVPVALAAAAVAAVTVLRGRPDASRARRGAWRAAGPVAGLLVVALCAVPVAAGLEGQRDAAGNTHDLVFTVVLPALGPDATAPLGLPREAAARSGESFSVVGGAGIPGWPGTIGRDPDAVHLAALRLLAVHPDVVLGAVDAGLVATMRPQLPYLAPAPRGTSPDSGVPPRPHPDSPQFTAPLLEYLGAVPLGRLPLAVVLLGVVAGLATLVPGVRRGIGPPAVGLARTAAAGVLTTVALVGAAVLGEGLDELTRHVWLASFVLLTSALALLAAGVATVARVRQRL